jgi:hypothetical protein
MLKPAIVTAMLTAFGGFVTVVAVNNPNPPRNSPPESAPDPEPPARPKVKLPTPGGRPLAREGTVPDVPQSGDLRQELATIVKKRIATQEEELTKCIATLSEVIEKFNRADYDSMDVTIEAFKNLTQQMRALAAEVIKGYDKFASANEQLRRELRNAPEAYRQAAAYYRERANDYEDPVLKQNCRTLAENCELFIPIFKDRLASLDTFHGEVGRMQPFLRETAAWLKDFEDYLNLWPGGSTAAPRRQYREKLKLYAKTFAEFQTLFERFNEKLREATFSSRLQSERESKAFADRSQVTARLVRGLCVELRDEFKVIERKTSGEWDERKRRMAESLAQWQTRHHLLCRPLVLDTHRSGGVPSPALPNGCHYTVIAPDGCIHGTVRVVQTGRVYPPEGIATFVEAVEGSLREKDLLVVADYGGRTGDDEPPAGGGL